ncbi:protein-L-isoaspartate O-methyltransferase [Mycotypha africana]|uniref:protein-L-isoaspartate O-methyltransferase n=1 Tax=Mycotypha africana TaxID=64632 RepID=UPI0023007DCE|nr:protein-L-isoaspartate O-methyltransferase [Mycotypha africana]KAI8971984.1 protein-L-isoaspartate O-methyltransferase [Mycotypha africana]
MEAVNRKDFCPRNAFIDNPESIGYGATISAPHMHGYALEMLEPYLRPGMKALDIGSGSGYLSACMAHMVGERGKVVGVEHIKELVEASIRNCRKSHSEWIDNGLLKLIEGDGRLGYKSEGPYDCIHVGAAAPSKPDALIDQLNSPGRLFIPVGTTDQAIVIYDKDKDGKVSEKKWLGVQYVLLTDASTQKARLY